MFLFVDPQGMIASASEGCNPSGGILTAQGNSKTYLFDKHGNNKTPQTIWPYTDMLLHDMGSGLADNRPEYLANGQEWRTPPLWGIGLTEKVSGHTFFLHDGRARNLLEAILWHGGEAEPMRQAVVNLSTMDRDNLLHFLQSL